MKIGTLLRYRHHKKLGVFIFLGETSYGWCRMYSMKTGKETNDLLRDMEVIHEVLW